MHTTVTRQAFHDAFQRLRPTQFSYAALNVIFDYFDEWEQSTGEQVELDVIAICCDVAEMTTDEFIDAYRLSVDDDATDERKMHEVCEHIQHHSSLIGAFDNTVIFNQF